MRHFVLTLSFSIAIAGLIAVGLFFFLRSNFPQTTSFVMGQKASITGSVNFNGVIPDNATFTFSQRVARTTSQFTPFLAGVVASDNALWSFDSAEVGKSYEIQGTLVVGGQAVATSDAIFVTAPAQNAPIVFNVVSQAQTGTAVISGIVKLDGYVPADSTITVEGRLVGKQAFTPIASGLPADTSQFLTYSGALAGKAYDIRGKLFDKQGNQIGQSSLLTVSAPAENEMLVINSTAKPSVTPTPGITTSVSVQPTNTSQPSSQASGPLSGSIQFNGAAQANTRIVVFERVMGTSNYSVAQDNITPVSGVNWQWTGAKAGTWYDLLAVFKLHNSDGTDTDISSSNVVTVAAPASGVNFTINSGFSLPVVNGTITFSCGNYVNGSNIWNASIAFQTVQNAQSYWFQVGTSNGGTELTTFTQNATNNPTQSIPVTLVDGTTYYARYAYSAISNAPSSQFSPFSSAVSGRCAKQ